jgi:2-polyprenyl-3-methyl-5-hydroxy-6-metoxy-1,4-benzoquinol methylase
MQPQEHWQSVYLGKPSTTVSWFQPEPARSLEWIQGVAPLLDTPIIDVGAGASLLVDRLLARGYTRLALLDIALAALDEVRRRLGTRAAEVEWFTGDVLDFAPPHPFGVWHDRAVLHFLTHPHDQRRYVEVLRSALEPHGHALIATFAKGGPTRCSGLEIVQYDAASLGALLGPEFTLVRAEQERHRTPAGSEQLFQYALFQRLSP